MSTSPDPSNPPTPAPTSGPSPVPAPPPPATDSPAPPGPDPAAPPAPTGDDPPLGPAGEKALAEWKKRAKEAERQAADHATLIKEFEDAQKSEAERLTDRAAAAEERAATATRLAVAAKVEALATATFEDPEDAIGSLDPAKYVDADGRIDTDAIKAELAALLERKPHWAKATGPRQPKPDPAQGPRPGAQPGDVETQIREAQAKGDWRTVVSLQNNKLANLK